MIVSFPTPLGPMNCAPVRSSGVRWPSGASSGTVFAYGARAKYLMSPSLEPAVEIFGETGRIGHSGDFNTQEHWIGPALYGSIGLGHKSKIGYSAAFLFGTTSVSSDNRAVLRLEYEFY